MDVIHWDTFQAPFTLSTTNTERMRSPCVANGSARMRSEPFGGMSLPFYAAQHQQALTVKRCGMLLSE